ncbi:hypothetical protein [Clostridium butyricum]|uniref:hypothetical protein n=1 Tax=Clostridium butyricum TaxID=1492 RepID=UPI0012B96CF6|nr:hypothetical protein [Clostridium butyricum]
MKMNNEVEKRYQEIAFSDSSIDPDYIEVNKAEAKFSIILSLLKGKVDKSIIDELDTISGEMEAAVSEYYFKKAYEQINQ